ncbi:hypothetical protein OVS_03330 [Mycoplasma ovis str. Michigan]|uniref:Uncharacterized protein n=1 Tax=Mycoplasma ovis str. Michigan TaxID=1415773 RepID=A0ABN4BN42_9MOLU|nr:hypothetical protein OVS_03295 [Mycoplasma ovis str. Michigan]AHC40418.1 hypothetical protein OVS_03330 [Mycoplasma ovis str. Michigan]
MFYDCVGEDGHYRVKLAFGEENATGDALYDLFFDFIDIKTGKSVGRLGQKFQGEEKFNLVLTSFPGLGRWGVALQSKLSSRGWLSLTCQKINLEVAKEKQCGVDQTGCVTTREFKKIQFIWRSDRESKKGLIKQGLEIKSGSDLKWVDSFKPKAIFSNH